MPDPTKQEGEPESKIGEGEGGNPQGTAIVTPDPTPAAQPQSPLTEKEVQEYRAWKEALGSANVTDPKSLVSDYTRKAQRVAELEPELARVRDLAATAIGRAQPHADPEAEARQAWIQSRYTADEDRAFSQYEALKERRIRREASADAVSQMRVLQSVPIAAEMLGIQDENVLADRLTRTKDSLTLDELALVALRRDGKLGEYVSKSNKQREDTARRAAALDSFGPVRGAPRVPGSNGSGQKVIAYEEWAALNPAAKLRLRQAKDEIVISGAPKSFDPNDTSMD